MFEVKEVSEIDLIFSTGVEQYMPVEIPKEFYQPSNIYRKQASSWFFKGLNSFPFSPKEGINKNKALRHLRAILTSFEPSHEDKMAGVAYLLSEWFDYTGE